jgi:hypothetical protein
MLARLVSLRSLLSLWLAVLVAGAAGMGPAAAGTLQAADGSIELRRGTVTTSIDGITRTGPVELSYHWDRQHRGRPGLASFDLPFTLAAAPETPWGIFIPRVGNVFEVQLNGALLQVYGDLGVGNDADYAKAPIYVPVPGRLLKPARTTCRSACAPTAPGAPGSRASSSGPPRRCAPSSSRAPMPGASPARCC